MSNLTTALAFSGGKDSLACLLLNRAELGGIVVLWVNTGKNYPEVVDTINRFRSMCHHFVEIKVDRDAQNRRYGPPSSLVPVTNTEYGAFVTQINRPRIQSDLECCSANLAVPLFKWCKEHGVTTIIRGQRRDDEYKGPINSGDTLDGITFVHPVEDWTAEKVISYLEDELGELPGHMYFDHSSMDCYDCTGFQSHARDRIAYTRIAHPKFYKEYTARRDMVVEQIRNELQHYEVM